MRLLRPAPAFVLGLAVLSAGCTVTLDSHSEIVRDERRFPVDGRPDVRVSTFDGSIEIQSWDKPEVLVEIEKRGPTKAAIDALQVVASQKGRVVELEVKRPRKESFSGIGLHRTAYARLIVNVPRGADLRAQSGDGSIRIARVDGRIQLRTGDGSIRASNVTGELALETGDGSVTVDDAEGTLRVETGDGSVNVSGKLAVVRLHTGDGAIVYRALPGTAMLEPWELSSGDGGISLYLPNDFDAELDAHTGDGAIRSELSVEDRSSERDRRTLRARLGSGGQLLRIRTGDGAIRLRPH